MDSGNVFIAFWQFTAGDRCFVYERVEKRKSKISDMKQPDVKIWLCKYER